MMGNRGTTAPGTGEMHKADGLVPGAAAGACDAGDGNRDICQGFGECTLGHGARDLFADGAMQRDQHLGHAEHLHLGLVRVGHEAALDHIG